MAVNLTPQYHEAEAEYRKAQSAEDKLAALKKMWTALQKPKSTRSTRTEPVVFTFGQAALAAV